jgi:hypothetical protein
VDWLEFAAPVDGLAEHPGGSYADPFNQFSIDNQGRIVEASKPSAGEALTSEARFSYQYDEHGNLVEHVISSRPQPVEPFTVFSVGRRSLTYKPA